MTYNKVPRLYKDFLRINKANINDIIEKKWQRTQIGLSN